MYNDKKYMDEITEYMRKNLAKGYKKESLKWTLISQGYSKVEVEKAAQIAEMEIAKQLSKAEEKPVITRTVEPLTADDMPKQSFFSKVKSWFG